MSTIAWSPFGNRMLSEVERWAASFARPALVAAALDAFELVSWVATPTYQPIDRYGLRDPAYAREKINGVPRPAVFVLDQQGRVRWAMVETDYRERTSSEEVAAALDAFE